MGRKDHSPQINPRRSITLTPRRKFVFLIPHAAHFPSPPPRVVPRARLTHSGAPSARGELRRTSTSRPTWCSALRFRVASASRKSTRPISTPPVRSPCASRPSPGTVLRSAPSSTASSPCHAASCPHVSCSSRPRITWPTPSFARTHPPRPRSPRPSRAWFSPPSALPFPIPSARSRSRRAAISPCASSTMGARSGSWFVAPAAFPGVLVKPSPSRGRGGGVLNPIEASQAPANAPRSAEAEPRRPGDAALSDAPSIPIAHETGSRTAAPVR